MRRPSRSSLIVVLGCAVLLHAAGAHALPSGVPSAGTSIVPNTLVTCPAGHITFTLVVKDAAANPVANSTVVVDFCAGAPPIDICSTTSCTFLGTTNASGVVVLNIPAGGTAAASVASIKADGVLLANRAVASTDQNGDQQVTAADVAAVNALLGGTDKRGDLDGDGFVTAADVAIVQAHLTHVCSGPVGSRDGTWGVVKIRYR